MCITVSFTYSGASDQSALTYIHLRVNPTTYSMLNRIRLNTMTIQYMLGGYHFDDRNSILGHFLAYFQTLGTVFHLVAVNVSSSAG